MITQRFQSVRDLTPHYIVFYSRYKSSSETNKSNGNCLTLLSVNRTSVYIFRAHTKAFFMYLKYQYLHSETK